MSQPPKPLTWKRCARTTTYTHPLGLPNTRTIERQIFPHTNLEAWTKKTAIWHFESEDCSASKRLGHLYDLNLDVFMEGQTIMLHPVTKKICTRRNRSERLGR